MAPKINNRMKILKSIRKGWKWTLCLTITALFILLLPSWNNAIAHDYEATKNVQSASQLSPPRGFASRRALRIHPRVGTIALTFDDGPHPKYTPAVLAILRHYNVKATFFVIGKSAQEHPELIRAILADGHVIASHTMTHPQLTRLYGEKLYNEVVGPNLIIQNITGQTPTCLRPPYGAVNQRIRNYIESQHMRVVLWDWDPRDYQRQFANRLTRFGLSHTRSGYTILMHDGTSNSFQSVQALPLVIEGLQQMGFKFVTICNASDTEPLEDTPNSPTWPY